MDTASIPSSVLNLVNNVVGAGLFSMPWCLKEATVLTGCVMFVFICALNIFSFGLLAKSCELKNKFSYLELGQAALGREFGTVAQVTTICYTAGSLVSYVVLAGDCLVGKETGVLSLWLGEDSFLGGGSLLARAVIIYSMGIFVFLPMSLPRSLDALKYASFLALGATLFAGAMVVYQLAADPSDSRADDDDDDDDDDTGSADDGGAWDSSDYGLGFQVSSSVVWFGVPLGVWEAVPLINVAFTAHYNGPRFFEELSFRTLKRFRTVCVLSLGGALLIYLSVALGGYLSFGDATLGDVLENFKASYPLAIGSRLALLVILVAVFPKAQFSTRDGLIRLLYRTHNEREAHARTDSGGEDSGDDNDDDGRHQSRDSVGNGGGSGCGCEGSPSTSSPYGGGGGALGLGRFPSVTSDTLPLGPYLALTALVVLAATSLGVLCTRVEVVLAYKGGVFGSLLVYILPSLMHTAIVEAALGDLNRSAPVISSPVPPVEKESEEVQSSGSGDNTNSPPNNVLSPSGGRIGDRGGSGDDGRKGGKRVGGDFLVRSNSSLSGYESSGDEAFAEFIAKGAGGVWNGGGPGAEEDDDGSLGDDKDDGDGRGSGVDPTGSVAGNENDLQRTLLLPPESPTSRTTWKHTPEPTSAKRRPDQLKGGGSSRCQRRRRLGFFSVLNVMFTKPRHFPCAFLFVWGVSSGFLGVGVTIARQAGFLSS